MYKSNEERSFARYLDVLLSKGIISEYQYEPTSFILQEAVYIKVVEKGKLKKKLLTRQVKYTPDFRIKWVDTSMTYSYESPRECPQGFSFAVNDDNVSYVEVKGSFDRYNMERYVKVKIAWLYDKQGVLVQIIHPAELFKKTFSPPKLKRVSKPKKKTKK